MRYLLFVLLFFMFSGISNATELIVGLIPEQNVFKQFRRYKPLGEYIEKKAGVKVKFSVLPRYGNIIESFQKGEMDGAFWGSFTGALAIEKLGIEFLARPVNLDGTSTYKGYLFVHKYSVIDSVERMRHSIIAFVDKATTAGYIFPMAYLKERGVKNIDSYFKEYYFTGSHDAAVYAVVNKEANIGCAKNTIFDMLVEKDPEVKENLVVIAESPEVPSNGLGVRKDLEEALKKKLQRVLLEMSGDPEGKKVLEEFGVINFIETSADDFSPVFDMANKAGINIKTYNYKNE